MPYQNKRPYEKPDLRTSQYVPEATGHQTPAPAPSSANHGQAGSGVTDLNRVYAVLSGINAAIVRIRDRHALFEECCRVLIEHGGFEMAWIGILDHDSRAVTPTVWRGPAPDHELISSVEFSADEQAPGGRTTIGMAIRERRPVSSAELRFEGEIRERFNGLLERGYRSVLSLPLLSGKACVGVIVVYSRNPEIFDDDEMRLLNELVENISFALDYIRNEERVTFLAFKDPLTGLANRAMLYRRLSEAIGATGTGRKPFALLLMNINNFQDINHTLGHHNGDLLLREAAERLESTLWQSDIVACLGGDEFAIVLPGVASDRDVNLSVEKVSGILQKQFVIQGLPINVEARLGVSLYPDHGESADSLWQNADIALRAAKERHRAWVLYAPEIDHHDPQQLALIGGLRGAMDRSELLLHYQPRIDLRTGHTRGVEALLRWEHPDRGLIYPDAFIPLAERTGLINPLTTWVLANALRQGHIWDSRNLPLDMSVNLSARNLQDSDLSAGILELARSSRFPLERLQLEITESAIMSDPSRARAVLQELSDAGVRMSLDDFGTGQASLAYVRDLPITALKIDKSFVMDFAEPRNAAIVRSAIELGHNLGLSVTAEGVEDEAAYETLCELGCDVAQGYFFSRPLPVDQLMTWLRNSRWTCGCG